MNKISIIETNKILNVQQLCNTIYNNFIYLSNIKLLMHTKYDIQKILLSEQLLCYLIYFNNSSLIGYLVGEFRALNDSRYVYYISYLFVSESFRNKKIGTLMMKLIIKKCKSLGVKFILLTCDSNDNKIVNFYKKLGFIKDPILNSTSRYQIFCLFID